MKRLASFVLAMVLCFACQSALAENKINVIFAGETLQFDSEPVIINGRTMVPMRKIFEKLGAKVEWDGEKQRVCAVFDDGRFIVLYIGDTIAYVNEEAKILETAPFIKDSRTFVPLRFVSEGSGAGVTWDGATYTVKIVPEWHKAEFVPFGEFMSVPSPAGVSDKFVPIDYKKDSAGARIVYDASVGTENILKYEKALENFGFARVIGGITDERCAFYKAPVVVDTSIVDGKYIVSIYADANGNILKQN